MRKQIFLALLLTFGLTASGCAWFGGDTSSTEAAITPAQPEAATEPAPAPAPPATGKAATKAAAKADKKAAKTPDKKPSAKGAKTEAQIAAELETVGRKLVAQAGRTVVPSKAKKDVRQVGKDFVASYVEVDESTISTELRPGASGQYVGFVRYKENVYECHGASRQAALTAACEQVKARRINELIRYDGSSWQY
ncbi:MAG: translation initiation factor 2 [Desulfovibrio sp.]|uniref:translation initiation factor 2 n=1 Tax=Desulfovibrio sp. TaxID=885 RepID=UPI0039E3E3BD